MWSWFGGLPMHGLDMATGIPMAMAGLGQCPKNKKLPCSKISRDG